MRVRPALPEDAEILAAAAQAIARVPGRLASKPEEIRVQDYCDKISTLSSHDRARYLVVELDGRLAGQAVLEPHRYEVLAHVVFLTMAVHQGFQGRGLGRLLLEQLLNWARSHPHIEKVELQVRSSNAPAIGLYRSLGFEEEGRKRRRLKYGPGEYLDDVYMALWVGPD